MFGGNPSESLGEKGMTYETRIGIEIAGIRRSIRVEFKYRIKAVKSKPVAIHESATVCCWGERSSGEWIYDAMGTRQLEELDSRLIECWKSEKGKAA
jgi:hypothetical protein